MAESDGNGWVECRCGSRHWGRYGAAGLLLRYDAPTSGAVVLLQHRAPWSHEGGTWGLPGGARDSHEDVVTAALRETWEEAGIDAAGARFLGVHRTVHPDWSYTTVLMSSDRAYEPSIQAESLAMAWVPVVAVADLPLHPGFAASWPLLQGTTCELLVDVANVMGARPDGWWRDRAAAAQRLIDALVPVAGTAVAPNGSLITAITAVVEGDARAVTAPDPAIAVVAASTADEHIVATSGSRHLVVTADRDVVDQARHRGAAVVGPKWLWSILAAT